MESIEWMAWTWPTALFFIGIVIALATMIYIAVVKKPAGKVGILGLTTFPGDRLFISLLGSAFILLLWMAFTDKTVWIASAIALGYSVFVFRFV